MSHNGNKATQFSTIQHADNQTKTYGRGMLLLNSLCENVNILDEGRKVEVVYRV